MILQLNLNKLFLILFPLIISCNDPTTITTCSPNQQLDSCGNCYYNQNDSSWNNCVDDCGIANGENVCDEESIANGYCECAGCKQLGNLSYCSECLYENNCDCQNSLNSYYTININECDQNSCNDFYFDSTSLNLTIRQRCGTLTSIDANYIINRIDNISFYDPCGEQININYFDDTSYTYDVFDGCELPINSIYILDNGDIIYNSSDDIGDFEFSIANHCENLNSNTCQTITGCSWGNNNSCIQDNINQISNGDAQNQGYYISSQFINGQYYIIGNRNNSVIPSQNDYLNYIQIKNNEPNNSLYIKWIENEYIINEYIEIPPNEIKIFYHNNLCQESIEDAIIIQNDNLTIHPTSKIEGYYYSNNDYVKFDEINVELIFKSLTEIYNSLPQNCN